MLRAVADTHTVVWYLYDDARLSLAEMIYLIEKGRIDAAALTRLMAALDAADAVLVEIPFDRHVAQAMTRVARTEVSDLPDRIIAATALHWGIPVISHDRKIQKSTLTTVW
jgi:predicted nucleic acid-binding protein